MESRFWMNLQALYNLTQALEKYLPRVNREDLVAKASRQPLVVTQSERRHRDNPFWQGDITKWK